LVIGIGAVKIYSTPSVSLEAQDRVAQVLYNKNYDELGYYGKVIVDIHFPSLPTIHEKNTQFKEWLVMPLKWIVKPLGIFFLLTAILTTALVVSRMISNKIKLL